MGLLDDLKRRHQVELYALIHQSFRSSRLKVDIEARLLGVGARRADCFVRGVDRRECGAHARKRGGNEPAAAAGARMVQHKIGCLPVVDAEARLAGIVTEEDFLRWATAHMAPVASRAAS